MRRGVRRPDKRGRRVLGRVRPQTRPLRLGLGLILILLRRRRAIHPLLRARSRSLPRSLAWAKCRIRISHLRLNMQRRGVGMCVRMCVRRMCMGVGVRVRTVWRGHSRRLHLHRGRGRLARRRLLGLGPAARPRRLPLLDVLLLLPLLLRALLRPPTSVFPIPILLVRRAGRSPQRLHVDAHRLPVRA